MIRCTDENGQWLEPTILKLHITPPWYATWWAYLLWTLVVIGIIIAVIWAYLHELDIKHKMQIVNVQRNTMKKLNEAKIESEEEYQNLKEKYQETLVKRAEARKRINELGG